jgi:hypothetical protein
MSSHKKSESRNTKGKKNIVRATSYKTAADLQCWNGWLPHPVG